MAKACCRKEYTELCEIHVCEDAPYSDYYGFYERLRFGLLASSWLPLPLGILLWRALNAILFVSGLAFAALGLVTAFIFYGVVLYGIWVIVWTVGYGVFIVVLLVVDFVLLLRRSLRFCWSVAWNWVRLRVCRESSIVVSEWRGGAWVPIPLWEVFRAGVVEVFWACVPDAVPWWRPSLQDQEMQQRKMRDLKLWCGEVMHGCVAFAI